MGILKDLTGKKFGRLTVVKRAENGKNYKTRWLCKCDCGNYTIVYATHLQREMVLSCGCYNQEKRIERRTTHGLTNTRLFRIWTNMKTRCYNTKNYYYKYYGNRGIKICEEWKDNFENFYKWSISNGYEDNLTIDRIDNNGNYEPNNCRWITQLVQANNKRNNKILSYNNVEHTLPEWARILNINVNSLNTCIRTYKMTLEDVIKNRGIIL